MLMRSPVHPSLLGWALRPEPTGRRRLVAAYLTTAAGSVAALIILGITLLVTRHCQSNALTGFGCMAPFFHGLGLSIIGGLFVILGASIFIKLGLRFVLSLLAFAAPVLLITQLLSMSGAESEPYAMIAMVGVPAAAGWISARALRDQQPSTPLPTDRQPNRQRSRVATTRL